MIRNLLLIVTAMQLISCQNQQTDEINIAFPEGPSALTFLYMLQDTTLIDGKNINFHIKSDPLQIVSLMMQQKVNFAVLPTVMAANLYNKGVDYRVLAIPVWGTLYLVSNNPEIENINDLQGKTIHLFGRGATADVLFNDFINRNQLKNIRVNFDFSSNQELALALSSKRIETAILSEPLVSQLMINNPDIKIISALTCENPDQREQTNIFTQTSFVVSNAFLKENPELTYKVFKMYESSCKFSLLQPKVAALYAEKSGLLPDAKAAEFSLPLCNIRFESAEKAEKAIFQYLKIFYNINPGSIGGKIPDKNFIVTENQLSKPK
jgi:NitT/TauT family transport system substrate-binding protein